MAEIALLTACVVATVSPIAYAIYLWQQSRVLKERAILARIEYYSRYYNNFKKNGSICFPVSKNTFLRIEDNENTRK